MKVHNLEKKDKIENKYKVHRKICTRFVSLFGLWGNVIFDKRKIEYLEGLQLGP